MKAKDAAGKDIDAFPIAVDKSLYRARPDSVRHLLHALPRRDRQRSRHDCAARLQAAAVLSHRPSAQCAGGPFLRRDHERLRRDAELRACRCSRATAGRLSPTSARCSTAKTPTSTICHRKRARAYPPRAASLLRRRADEPMAPPDTDFVNFPAKPATPSGVPGAHGAGAVHRQAA